MKQFLTVFRFTFLDAVRKKAFIISTAVVLAAILIACSLPRIIDLFSNDSAASEAAEEVFTATEVSTAVPVPGDYNTYLMDESNAIESAQLYLSFIGLRAQKIGADRLEEAQEAVLSGDAEALIKINAVSGVPEAEIFIRDFMHAPNTSAIQTQLNNAWRADRLREAGADEVILSVVSTSIPVYEQALGSMDLTVYIFGIIVSMLMFFAVYFYGLSVANSVALEKTSRVMETLVVSAKPTSILLGKCVATGAAGLLQMGGVILFGVAAYNLLVPEGTMIFGMPLSFSGVTTVNLIIMILYFLLGYALYALIYAVCGATVSRIEDVSSALMPVSMVSLLSFYLGYMTSIIGNSSGWIEWAARYVPFASPFGMPFRLLNGSVTVGQCAVSLSVIAVFIMIFAFISVRLYEAGIMHYGSRLKLKDLIGKKQ